MDDQMSVVQEKQGAIVFANDVLATIAGIAACEVPGIAGMCGGFKDGIVDLLGRKNLSKGVQITVKENQVTVDLAIVVDYGAQLLDVCTKIQDGVKKALETMTGLAVVAVNIDVQGVRLTETVATAE